MDDPERSGDERPWEADEDLERASENVLVGWPGTAVDTPPDGDDALDDEGGDLPAAGDDPAASALPEAEQADEPDSEPAPEAAPDDDLPAVAETSSEHAPGELSIPPGYAVLEGEPRGGRRAVGIVVSRFNGEVTGQLLQSALDELEALGVGASSITVMPVPGAFELPIAAMALAKTRRFACVVALGCVIRGDTPHFDYVASEAASGLQLAAIETGVPVAFGVLTLDRPDQAAPRVDKGAEAVRTALEMADLFANLRAAAAR
jgi:6,7-dimethyl-8-ribityllumazine synthase